MADWPSSDRQRTLIFVAFGVGLISAILLYNFQDRRRKTSHPGAEKYENRVDKPVRIKRSARMRRSRRSSSRSSQSRNT
ncbi:hypothetical protein Q1695_008010 [Nippostrongylus brasiliensis]|nr:hypothetical protein Q1695_008010 [Nippostrongylus brasiliensis]